MDKKELEEKIIQHYQGEEKMMILVFAQWCINHDVRPKRNIFPCISEPDS